MGDTNRILSIDKADRSELLCSLESSLGSSFSSEPIRPELNLLIIIICGLSGVGKDALIQCLWDSHHNLHFVITATTRPKRPTEVHGQDYYFVSKEEFLSMVEGDELLEYALVYGDYKAVPKQQIREFMAKGYDIVLRVDIQGAQTLRKVLGKSAVFIFLVAESEAAMVERLVDWKTEKVESLLLRIATVKEEMKQVKNFDYCVMNAQEKVVESIIV